MSKTDSHPTEEFTYHPHSPDIEERNTLDNGFSNGLGFHFQPNEAYWLDCHNHMENPVTHREIYRILEDWFSRLDAFRLGRVIAIVRKPEAFNVFRDLAAQDKRFGWLFRIPYDKHENVVIDISCTFPIGKKIHIEQSFYLSRKHILPMEYMCFFNENLCILRQGGGYKCKITLQPTLKAGF